MRKWIVWIKLAFSILVLIIFFGCVSQGFHFDIAFIPGIYYGWGKGYRGQIHVRVQISESGIEDIIVDDHNENPYPGLAAMEDLIDQILIEGTLDIDVISGATFTSRGFLEAVENALNQAR